jgi:thiamine-phosphate pyrophosphorylase
VSNRAAARIVDANLNRCREGLRTLEEYFRFALDDRGSAAALKSIRHDLSAASGEVFAGSELLSARSSAADVGAAGESAPRANELQTAMAAASRAKEALRAIEEYGGVLNLEAPARFAALRFRLYAAEKELAAGSSARKRKLSTARLYVLLTEALCANHDVLETARAAAAGGADIFQYREKELGDGEFLTSARRLAALCAELGVLLIINDRPHIARLCGADGVHLGQEDLPAAEAREILGVGRITGRSTHSPEQAAAAAGEGADYIGVGPVHATRTKEHASAVGTQYVKHCAENLEVPGFAIGAVNESTVDEVLAAGATRLAICTGVTMREDVEAAARFYRQKIDAACERKRE